MNMKSTQSEQEVLGSQIGKAAVGLEQYAGVPTSISYVMTTEAFKAGDSMTVSLFQNSIIDTSVEGEGLKRKKA